MFLLYFYLSRLFCPLRSSRSRFLLSTKSATDTSFSTTSSYVKSIHKSEILFYRKDGKYVILNETNCKNIYRMREQEQIHMVFVCIFMSFGNCMWFHVFCKRPHAIAESLILLLRRHEPNGLAGCCSFPPSPPVKPGRTRWLWFVNAIKYYRYHQLPS